MTTQKTLKVSSSSNVKKLAGSILSTIDEGLNPSLISIGPIALNQAVKGYLAAKGTAASRGMELKMEPNFCTLETTRGLVTAIRISVSWTSI